MSCLATVPASWHFAVEVERPHPSNTPIHRVDLWSTRRLLTCEDAWANVLRFCRNVDGTGGTIQLQ